MRDYKVYVCHITARRAEELVKINQKLGYEVLLDHQTHEYYVKVLEYPKVWRSEDNAPSK